MLGFLKWRKMTWALVVWNGAMAAWVLVLVASTSAAAGCSVDADGAAVSLARQDCLDGAAQGLGLPVAALIWALGLVVLSVMWYSTRPLWRQGHGARLRRLHSEDFLADAGANRTSPDA